MRFFGTFLNLLIFLHSVSVCAETPAAPPAGELQQKLDFEDSLIEGMNKRPYDSLSQISDRDKKKADGHLYWKRSNFQPESNESLRELRFVQ